MTKEFTDITDKNLIARQHAMKGLGRSVDRIKLAMEWTDTEIADAIEFGKVALANADEVKRVDIENAMKALEIEKNMRKDERGSN
jgi:hypothetical protein